jgi:hypothetical protein
LQFSGANGFAGVGSSLTALNASQLTSGTVPDARIAQTSVTQHQLAITGVGALNAGSITSGFGNIDIGTSTFTGNGSGLTSLNASNLSSGTVDGARLGGNQTMAGIKTFSDISQATSTTTGAVRISGGLGVAGNLYVGGVLSASGANLTNLDASNLTSGTVPNARLTGTYSGITGTGALNAGSITSGFGNINIGTSTFTGNGSGLTTLDASNLSSGTVPDARLSSNVVLLSGTQTITGAKTFDANLTLGSSAELFFGSATRQNINLFSNSYGIGVQSNTQYYRSASRFSWFRGGVHNNTENNPGAGGTVAMTLDSSSNLAVTGNVSATAFSGNGSGLTGVTAGSLANSVTFNNGGGGAASGTAFNGAAGVTVSWNTIGAVTTNNTNQTVAGTKTFSAAVVLSTAGTATTHAVRADRAISTSGIATGGGNLTADRTINVPGTNLSWTNGTTAGPTVNSSTGGNAVMPTASASISGAVTTGAQTWAGNKSFTGTIRITGNGQSYRQNTTATWGGNPGNGEGKIEYHSNRWYYVSGADSTEIARWRQAGTDRAWLTNAGAFNAANEITAFASDGRLKENVKNIESPLDKLNKINGVTYDWKLEDCAKWNFEPANKSDIGFIAQEIQAIIPEAVAPAPFDVDENGNSRSGENYLTVKPEKVIPLLVEAIKEQQNQIDELKEMVKKLLDK